MGYYDGGGASDVGYKVMYYCTRCEVLFELSPIAPLRCPTCYCDPRYIIGPIPAKEIDIGKLKDRHNRKYRGKISR